MPVKGYCSMNVPVGLYYWVKGLVRARSDLGYRSMTEFVLELVRVRLVDLGETGPVRCVS